MLIHESGFRPYNLAIVGSRLNFCSFQSRFNTSRNNPRRYAQFILRISPVEFFLCTLLNCLSNHTLTCRCVLRRCSIARYTLQAALQAAVRLGLLWDPFACGTAGIPGLPCSALCWTTTERALSLLHLLLLPALFWALEIFEKMARASSLLQGISNNGLSLTLLTGHCLVTGLSCMLKKLNKLPKYSLCKQVKYLKTQCPPETQTTYHWGIMLVCSNVCRVLLSMYIITNAALTVVTFFILLI